MLNSCFETHKAPIHHAFLLSLIRNYGDEEETFYSQAPFMKKSFLARVTSVRNEISSLKIS